LYYSKDASSVQSVVQLPTADGNIHYQNIAHTFKAGSCIHCGAPEAAARDLEALESHAYLFIHEELDPTMKFDVIIGNPPYQLKDGGHGASASPLYHKFVQQAIAANPKYMSMIIPSRWFAGGKGLDEFRAQMLADRRMKVLVDHADAGECFPGVEIKGGVCYFLWDEKHGAGAADTCVVRNLNGDAVDEAERRLDGYDVFIRFNKAVSILEKVLALKEQTLDTQVSSRKPFGFATNFDDYKKKPFEGALQFFARGEVGWIAPAKIVANTEWVPKWKVFTSMAYGAGEGFPHQITGKPIVAAPNSACTETYLVLGVFDSEAEANNFAAYQQTRFFRFLVSLRKNTQHLTRDRFSFVPKLDMAEVWDDAKLYARYGITADEAAYIESMIKEMA
jgi:site-specific DNA-methyltransferase (adenine-specific)